MRRQLFEFKDFKATFSGMTKSRHFQGGRNYHVTPRCHGRAFLLGKDVDLLLRKLGV